MAKIFKLELVPCRDVLQKCIDAKMNPDETIQELYQHGYAVSERIPTQDENGKSYALGIHKDAKSLKFASVTRTNMNVEDYIRKRYAS